MKVLVVEDDAHQRKVIKMVLERDRMLRYHHPEVILAADGEEGWTAFREHLPDLVITDLLMPKVDGYELIKRVRTHEHGKEVPILVVTAMLRDRFALSRLERDSGVVVQAKPFAPRVLSQRIRALLKNTRGDVDEPAKSAKPVKAKEPKTAERSAEAGSTKRAIRSSAGKLKKPAAKPKQGAKARLALPGPESAPAGSASPESDGASPSAQRAAASGQTAVSPQRQRKRTPMEVITGGGEVRKGVVGQPSVPRLLLDLLGEQASGALDLKRNKVRKVIYILAGHPIFVQSNVRSETLGQLLVRRGGLSEAKHRRALSVAEQHGLKYGEALVRLKLMTDAEVMEELVRQTRFKVQSCLRWADGEWAFHHDDGIGGRVPRCTIEPVVTIFKGLGAAEDLPDTMTRLAQLAAGKRLRVSPALAPFTQTFAQVFGTAALAKLKEAPSISELLEAPQATVVMAVETLLACGLAELEDGPPEVRRAPKPEVDSAPSPELIEEVARAKGLDGMVERVTAEAVEEPVLRVASGEVRVKLSGTWEPQVEEEEQRKNELARALVEAAYLNLHSQTYYQTLGVIPQTDDNGISVAYNIKRSQFDLGRFRDRDLGEAYAHLEELVLALDTAYETLSNPERRAAYDASLALGQQAEPDRGLEAENLFKRGLDLQGQGDHAAACELFEEAVALDDRPEYRAQEALAYFAAEGESPEAGVEAMVRVQAALADNPDQPEAHFIAARISRGLGATDEALEHLREALKLDPAHQGAFDEVESMLLESGATAQLEREYRRTIFRLGRKNGSWAAVLWKRLVLLYRDRLHDADRARKACDAAFRLNPRDGELHTMLLQLDSADPAAWPGAVLGYRALLRSDHDDAQPLQELFSLHAAAGRSDAALVAARIAVSRGATQSSLVQFVERHATRTLRRATSALDAAAWEALRHPHDDRLLVVLFEMLTPLMQSLDPLTLDDLGLVRGTDDSVSLSNDFLTTMRYVCEVLGISDPPTVRVKRELGNDIQAAGVEPPVLLVGASALQLTDRAELAFRLGRALTMLLPGRKVLNWRSADLLRDYLMAVVGVVYPEMELPEFSGRAMTIHNRIEDSQELLASCRSIVQRIHDRGKELDFDRWQQGLRFTADRLALLLCTDVQVASRAISEVAREAEIELVDFALSQQYCSLRSRFGLNA